MSYECSFSYASPLHSLPLFYSISFTPILSILLLAPQVLRDNEAEGILSSKLLLKRLLMLERAVQQNAYHRYVLMFFLNR
jgi:hypothetical protein